LAHAPAQQANEPITLKNRPTRPEIISICISGMNAERDGGLFAPPNPHTARQVTDRTDEVLHMSSGDDVFDLGNILSM
jgi:hypothetical protein